MYNTVGTGTARQKKHNRDKHSMTVMRSTSETGSRTTQQGQAQEGQEQHCTSHHNQEKYSTTGTGTVAGSGECRAMFPNGVHRQRLTKSIWKT